MRCILFSMIFMLVVTVQTGSFSTETEEAKSNPQILKLQVKKGEIFKYIFRTDLTREMHSQNAKEELLSKTSDVLEMEIVQTCKSVQENGDMVFDVTYGSFKLVRNIVEGTHSRKEVYTPESLTIMDENEVAITKKWTDLPSSEQTELRKLFVQGFTFTATPNGEIKEPSGALPFDRELPGFNSIKSQQAVYYHGQPMEDGTIWNWNKTSLYPKLKDSPLSEKNIPSESEYEFIELKEVTGIPCAAISVKSKSDYANTDENSSFTRELTEKAHIQMSNGMAVLVEGTLKSILSYKGLSKGIKVTTSGSFTIKRVLSKPE